MTETEFDPRKVKKGCPRCTYNKFISAVDYRKSARKQKIYYKTYKVCCRCNYPHPYSYKFPCYVFELDDYPKELINVDLSRIIHDHDHNLVDYIEEKPRYGKQGKCIELVLIRHYKCSFCEKKSEYTEICDKYDLNNPCKRMKELTEEYEKIKSESETKRIKNINKQRRKKEKYTYVDGKCLYNNKNKLMVIVI